MGVDLAPSEQAGQPMRLSWVPESRIPPDHRAFVRRHVDRAAGMLGLGPIRVRWFGPPHGDGDFTFTAPEADAIPCGVTPNPDEYPMTVGFLHSFRGPAVVSVVAHEVRHVAQNVALVEGETQTLRVESATIEDIYGDDEHVKVTLTLSGVRHYRELLGRMTDPAEREADAQNFARAYLARERGRQR
jgi:hypothetical protein